DEMIGAISTPLKRLGIQGWVDTGCNATATGVAIRDAANSTDQFWTIDLRLDKFTAGGASYVGPNPPRFLRIEVEPGTAAHGDAFVRKGQHVSVHGHVLVDTHHGEQLIEIHPNDPMSIN